jgi:hypothetical protein
MKIRNNPKFPVEITQLSRELGILWRELASSLNNLIEAYSGVDSGGSGGGTSNRWGSGIDTTDDVIIDDSDSGLVLKSPDGHYWRVQVTNAGALTITDVGTSKP